MDRLVSAYRNKLECRAGKEYYYQVIITIITTQQSNYNSSQKVTTLLLPVKFIFEEFFCRNMVRKLFRVTEGLENSTLERRGVRRNMLSKLTDLPLC